MLLVQDLYQSRDDIRMLRGDVVLLGRIGGEVEQLIVAFGSAGRRFLGAMRRWKRMIRRLLLLSMLALATAALGLYAAFAHSVAERRARLDAALVAQHGVVSEEVAAALARSAALVTAKPGSAIIPSSLAISFAASLLLVRSR